jgi:hypothetical protein
MGGQDVGVVRAAGHAVVPGLAAVFAVNEGTGFDADVDTAVYQRINRNPAHVVGAGVWGKGPGGGRGQVVEAGALLPTVAAVVGAIQFAGLGAGVNQIVLDGNGRYLLALNYIFPNPFPGVPVSRLRQRPWS